MGAAVASREKTSAVSMFWEPGMCPPGSKCCAGKTDSLASAAAEPPAAPKVMPAWKSSLSVFHPRLPAAQGGKFRPGGIQVRAPLCLRSVFPPRPRVNVQTRGTGSRGSCQRQVQGPLRLGFICELARLGSCMDYSCWQPRKLLMAQRAAARQWNGSSLQPGAAAAAARAEAGLVLEQLPAPEPAGELGRSLPAITEQLWHEAAAPGGPGAALLRAGPAQLSPSAAAGAGIGRGRSAPRRETGPRSLPSRFPLSAAIPLV